jgi:hypothetical protein
MKLEGQKVGPRRVSRGGSPVVYVYGIEEKGEYYLTGPAFETAGNAESAVH